MDDVSLFTQFTDKITASVTVLMVPTERLFVVYIFTAILLAIWVKLRSDDPSLTPKALWHWLVPKQVYWHRSTGMDVGIFIINALLFLGAIQVLLFSGFTVAAGLKSTLESWGAAAGWWQIAPVPLALLFTLLFFLAFDFAQYIAHYLQHKVWFLWEFHKVHHSAEVLNPLTAYRFHPIDIAFAVAVIALCTGIVQGILFWAAGREVAYLTTAGMHSFVFLFYLLGYNLRHSHIWLRYPDSVSHVFISPAQHQLHHSSAKPHWDKNMGFVLAIWDWMFGTLYIPKAGEITRYGIDGDEGKLFNQGVHKPYILPFLSIYKRLKNRDNKRKVMLKSVLFVLCFITAAPAYALPSLWLEEMTWQEIAEAQKAGTTRILIPTAGIEQNGPHMPLNKHAAVLYKTMPAIAEALGNTLIAPIINHVPEGDISPKSGHMQFPGTISMQDATFEAIVGDTVRSLHAHGFTQLYLLGDSLGNQAGQQQVAARLRSGWWQCYVRGECIQAHAIDHYYANAAQEAWLAEEGFSTEEIGGHAGVRDSAEYLAATGGQWRRPVAAYLRADYVRYGAWGDASKATEGLGNMLLKMKIEAAIAQIHAIEAAESE